MIIKAENFLWENDWDIIDGNLVIHLKADCETMELRIPLDELNAKMAVLVAARIAQVGKRRSDASPR